jgi:hypothetical protein
MVKGALLLTATVLFVALAFDLAIYFARLGRAQWEAEGMATAAARQLSINGSEADALSAASHWLENNERASTAECCTFADWRPLQRPDGIPRYRHRDRPRRPQHAHPALLRLA